MFVVSFLLSFGGTLTFSSIPFVVVSGFIFAMDRSTMSVRFVHLEHDKSCSTIG